MKRHLRNGVCTDCRTANNIRKNSEGLEVLAAAVEQISPPSLDNPPSTPTKATRKRRSIEITTPTKDASAVKVQVVRRRAVELNEVFNKLVGPNKTEESKLRLMKHFLNRHKSLVRQVLPSRFNQLSVDDGILFKATSGMPWTQLRWMKSFFNQRGLNVFPSECKMRNQIETLGIEYESGMAHTEALRLMMALQNRLAFCTICSHPPCVGCHQTGGYEEASSGTAALVASSRAGYTPFVYFAG